MNRISCENTRRLMPLYLSAELTGDALGEFSNHLAGCSSCFGEVERQMGLDRELRDAVLSEPVATGKTETRVREQIRREYWRRCALAGTGIAAATFMAFVTFASSRNVGILDATAKDHVAEVIKGQPRKWQAGADINALARRAGIQTSIPDLAKDGYALDRARLCKLDGKTWLHLVYKGPVHEISLYLHPDDGEGQSRLATVDGLSLGAFMFKTTEASLVSDSRDECRSLVNELLYGTL
jgi:anti-sigma factor RsiW